MTPGIHTISIEDYHSGPGVSKSGLHTILTKTPYHYRFGDRTPSNAQAFGSAAHTAILEPNLFEPRYMRGPDDRRGNKWTAAQEMAAAAGKECLTSGDYDDAMRLRDILHRDTMLRRLTDGAPAIEQSAYAVDEETGELVRVRPDLFNHDMRVMMDLKAGTLDSYTMLRNFVNFGYNLQSEMYPSIWTKAGGGDVDAFIFLCVEKDAPHAYRWVELPPGALEEGAAMYRKAMGIYHDCMEAERALMQQHASSQVDGPDMDAYLAQAWPMYGSAVETLEWPAYAYKLTQREVE